MTAQTMVSLGSLIVAALALIIGAWRSSKSDTEQDVKTSTALMEKLDNINNSVIEIKSDMKSTRSEMSELRDRTVKNEESTKQAHKRLDGVERRLEKLEGEKA